MPTEPMTLSERLLNPQWVHGPDPESDAVLDTDQTVAVMREVADLLAMKLPCDVKLPPRTTIRKGCTLQTLIVGLRARKPKKKQRSKLKCVNGHDRCYLGPDLKCPYCERV